MKWFSAASVVAILGSTLPSSGAAQAPSQAGPWFPEWSAPYCTISTGNPKELALSIWHAPGSAGVEIYFTSATGRLPEIPTTNLFPSLAGTPEVPRTEVLVQMADGKPAVPVTTLPTNPSVSHVTGFAMSSEDFFGYFASSNQFVVQQQRNWFTGMHYSGANEAMQALRHCVDAKLKEWGVDSTALAALRRRPILRLDSWVRYEDYPKDALVRKQSGTVVVRLATDESGKVTNCAVVLSSGVTSLDDVTCRIALKRARYKPAVGADGRRTSATFTNYAKYETDQ